MGRVVRKCFFEGFERRFEGCELVREKRKENILGRGYSVGKGLEVGESLV